jgi:hypothetical protein
MCLWFLLIVPPHEHIIAIGIDRAISWRLPAAEIVDEIHRQGGVAIAAHPVPHSQRSDAQVQCPDACSQSSTCTQLSIGQFQEFPARLRRAVIGSSDWHGVGPVGLCRTYVLATYSTPAVLDALRAGRTVVYDRDGVSYGNAAFIQRLLAIRAPTRAATEGSGGPLYHHRAPGDFSGELV